MSNNIKNNEGKLWYDVIKNEGEIHIIKGSDTTVFCSIYSEPLEDEDYAKAKLICNAVNSYQQPIVEQDKDIEGLAEQFFNSHKRTFDGVNAGEFIDKEDFLIFVKKDNTVNKEAMFSNMQYYMEYCIANGYVTPQDWIKKYKHF